MDGTYLKWAINKTFFVFHLILMTVSSKSDEKQKSFTNSPFVCSEFQNVSRIMKIVHSADLGGGGNLNS